LDVWVPCDASTSQAVAEVLREFGFSNEMIGDDFQLQEHQILRMGEPPLRIELVTSPSGVEFREC